jgi:hypothetical protein
MPQIPTDPWTGDWYLVVPASNLDRPEGELHGAAQTFLVKATASELAAQQVFDAYPDIPGVAVVLGEAFPRPA